VHDSDLRWGLRYFDNDPSSDDDDTALSTCFPQAIERELIQLGHLKPGRLIEGQLACVARSPEWWRRQHALKAAKTGLRTVQPLDVERPGEVLLQADATKPSGGRPRSLILAKIMREENCSRWTAYRILARRKSRSAEVS